MIIGYSRISTDQQDHGLQFDALKLARCERIYSDTASGAKQDRPELLKCLKFLQKGDILVVWKIDRIGRSLKHLINTVLDLNDRGVDVVITTMALDTRTPHGKLLFGILASIAEFERSLIKERVTAGIAAAKARGVKFGRPAITAKVLAKAIQQASGGLGVVQAAKQAGISKSRLYEAMAGLQ